MTDNDRETGQPSIRKRVLVVDDDALIGRAITRLLRDAFDVVCVTSGAAALAQLTEPHAFDAVLCDLSMPGMDGMELYRRLETVAPRVLPRLVFLTGGAVNPEARAFLAQLSSPQLGKPFDAQELRRVIESLVTSQ